MSVRLGGFGGLAKEPHRIVPLTDRSTAAGAIAGTFASGTEVTGLPRGAGLAYGDEPINGGGVLWDATGLDRFIAFDDETGLLTAEAGVPLAGIQRVFSERGWMLPVTPGTRFVTLAGAIANDVHGKNHATYGSFGEHVVRLTLARTDGEIIECGPDLEPEWYQATVGGMGLTGVILAATIRLKKVPGPWIAAEDLIFTDLDEFAAIAAESDAAGFEHTVGWVDVLWRGGRGRGYYSRGDAAESDRAPGGANGLLQVPVTPPISLVNQLSVPAFNALYFRFKALKAGPYVSHYLPFFYPLDGIRHWNRMYGPRGFFQYQSVVPTADGLEATREMLRIIASSGEGSFLTVLKTFGDRPSAGMLGFPMAGITLAVDFPNRGASTRALFDRLDAVVAEAGGRLYAAKDARMSRSMFETGYPRLGEFLAYRDPGISSDLSRRLLGS